MATKYGGACLAGAAWLAVIVLECGGATALEFKDIAGRWCTPGGTEEFDRDTLTAIPAETGEEHVYPIERYHFRAKKVTVVWRDDSQGESFRTDFSNFSADGRRMIQRKSAAAPRREFHRC
jgi:hypothetical protein